MPKKAEITRHLYMHMNGGPDFSMRVDEIWVDGVKTRITMGTGTNGSPEFKCTSHELCFHPPGTHGPEEEQRLDLMEEGMTDRRMRRWILKRRAPDDG